MTASPIAQNSTDRDAVLMELLAGQSRHPHLGQIAIALRDNLLNIYGDRLAHLILFGSQARGDAQPDSDLDLTSRGDKVHSAESRFHRSRPSTSPPASGVAADGRRADVSWAGAWVLDCPASGTGWLDSPGRCN